MTEKTITGTLIKMNVIRAFDGRGLKFEIKQSRVYVPTLHKAETADFILPNKLHF